MAMSEQKNDLCKEFIKHLLEHGGSYTDLFEIKLVHIAERINGVSTSTTPSTTCFITGVCNSIYLMAMSKVMLTKRGGGRRRRERRQG